MTPTHRSCAGWGRLLDALSYGATVPIIRTPFPARPHRGVSCPDPTSSSGTTLDTWRREMPRPHIEFVQHQDLPFQPARMGPTVGAETEVGIKMLSFDQESRASSGLVEISAGWR